MLDEVWRKTHVEDRHEDFLQHVAYLEVRGTPRIVGEVAARARPAMQPQLAQVS